MRLRASVSLLAGLAGLVGTLSWEVPAGTSTPLHRFPQPTPPTLYPLSTESTAGLWENFKISVLLGIPPDNLLMR